MREAMLNAAATTLKITAAELQTQLRAGQTVAQLAAAHGTTEAAVKTAALAAAKSELNEAVQAETITQAQADTYYARLEQEGVNFLNHGGRGGRGRGAPADAPEAPAPTATTTSL